MESTDNYRAYCFEIAGVQHHKWREAMDTGSLEEQSELTLVLEPENQYDDKAIAIYWEGFMLGYIPKKQEECKQLLYEKNLEGVRCIMSAVRPEDKPWNMFTVIVEVEV